MKNIKKMRRPEKAVAFNPLYPLYLLGLGICVWGMSYLWVAENDFSWVLFCVAAVFVLLLFVDAVYFVFTKEEWICVHFWGYKSRLPWSSVTSVEKHGFWETHRDIPHYSVHYSKMCKGRRIMYTAQIPLTPKIRTCMNTFYVGRILGENGSRRKKK